MVIELDVTALVVSTETAPWSPQSRDEFAFDDEIGDWLVERGHPGTGIYDEDVWRALGIFDVIPKDKLVYIQFDDPDLALLFKLTWL